MRSGIGVGGYCLTKDPLFAKASSNQILKKKFEFPISTKAVEINQNMTSNIMHEIKKIFGKKIFQKKVLLIGVSYREDTNDTRFSPAESVYQFFKKMKCETKFYDPVVKYWNYSKSYSVKKTNLANFEIYVYLIKHQIFKKLNISYKKNSLIFDLNHVLSKQKKFTVSRNYSTYFIGSK